MAAVIASGAIQKACGRMEALAAADLDVLDVPGWSAPAYLVIAAATHWPDLRSGGPLRACDVGMLQAVLECGALGTLCNYALQLATALSAQDRSCTGRRGDVFSIVGSLAEVVCALSCLASRASAQPALAQQLEQQVWGDAVLTALSAGAEAAAEWLQGVEPHMVSFRLGATPEEHAYPYLRACFADMLKREHDEKACSRCLCVHPGLRAPAPSVLFVRKLPCH